MGRGVGAVLGEFWGRYGVGLRGDGLGGKRVVDVRGL